MEIISGDIRLRSWTMADAKRIAVIADNKKIADNLRDGFPHPYTIKDALQWLCMVLPESSPTKFFAIVYDGQVAGSIGIVTKSDIYRKNVEIGYYIAEEYWGRGIATRAIKEITAYVFGNFDVVRIYAEPFSDNAGSRRALEKAGFRLEASLRNNVIKNGIIKDSCIYSILREDFLNFH